MNSTYRVLIVVGYFDWFSGYQETALASALARYVDVEIVTSTAVSYMFNASHLQALGIERHYRAGSRMERGVKITRVACVEKRAMTWSLAAKAIVEAPRFDLIIQAHPGQALPVVASLADTRAVRAALYGDNSAMWAQLPRWQRALKGMVFAGTKGLAYSFVNRRAHLVYGSTPNTLTRLRPFAGGKQMHLLPLTFDPTLFFYDEGLRASARESLGLSPEDVVVVVAGKFGAKKRIELVVDGCANLCRENPQLKLLLVGSDGGGYAAKVAGYVEQLPQLKGRVTILGFLAPADLNRVFNAADIGVWPRMPAITIQQAMASGLMVVLPDNDLVGHLVKPGSGIYMSGDNPNPREPLTSTLNTLVRESYSETVRLRRVSANAWLSADHVALELLDAARTVACQREGIEVLPRPSDPEVLE